MNRLSPGVQAALAECRKEMAAGLCHEQALKEEIDRLKSLLRSQQDGGAVTSVLPADDNADFWREECLRMQDSLSWKVTKPLRLVEKVLHSLRTVGLKLTLVKIFNHRK